MRQSSRPDAAYAVKELVIGIGNKELPVVDMDWLRGIADDFKGLGFSPAERVNVRENSNDSMFRKSSSSRLSVRVRGSRSYLSPLQALCTLPLATSPTAAACMRCRPEPFDDSTDRGEGPGGA